MGHLGLLPMVTGWTYQKWSALPNWPCIFFYDLVKFFIYAFSDLWTLSDRIGCHITMNNCGKAHASPPPSVNGSPPMSPVPGTGPDQMWGTSTGDNKRLQARLTATAKRSKYLRRLLKFRQMDFEYAFWQMLYLFVSPQKV